MLVTQILQPMSHQDQVHWQWHLPVPLWAMQQIISGILVMETLPHLAIQPKHTAMHWVEHLQFHSPPGTPAEHIRVMPL